MMIIIDWVVWFPGPHHTMTCCQYEQFAGAKISAKTGHVRDERYLMILRVHCTYLQRTDQVWLIVIACKGQEIVWSWVSNINNSEEFSLSHLSWQWSCIFKDILTMINFNNRVILDLGFFCNQMSEAQNFKWSNKERSAQDKLEHEQEIWRWMITAEAQVSMCKTKLFMLII